MRAKHKRDRECFAVKYFSYIGSSLAACTDASQIAGYFLDKYLKAAIYIIPNDNNPHYAKLYVKQLSFIIMITVTV